MQLDTLVLMHHVTISVRSLDCTAEFYELFGFRLALRWDAPDGSLSIAHLIGPGGLMLEAFQYATNAGQPERDLAVGNDLDKVGVKHFGFAVKDISVAYYQMSARFGERVTDIQRGRTGIDYFFVRDPDGIWVEVVQDDRKLDTVNPTHLP